MCSFLSFMNDCNLDSTSPTARPVKGILSPMLELISERILYSVPANLVLQYTKLALMFSEVHLVFSFDIT